MKKLEISAFDIAMKFVGVHESAGATSNPMILGMLRLDQAWPSGDEVPWCSAFVNWVAWLLGLPRSKSLAARSWLNIGSPIALDKAETGFDIVILKRGAGSQPGPEIISAPGHVGFFVGFQDQEHKKILLLGGNQSDSVIIAPFPSEDVLGVRRLA